MRYLTALFVLLILTVSPARAELTWLDSLQWADQVKRYDFYQAPGTVKGYIRTHTDPDFDTAVWGFLFSGDQKKLLARIPRNTSFELSGPGGWYQMAVTGTPARVNGGYEITIQSDASTTPIVPEPSDMLLTMIVSAFALTRRIRVP